MLSLVSRNPGLGKYGLSAKNDVPGQGWERYNNKGHELKIVRMTGDYLAPINF